MNPTSENDEEMLKNLDLLLDMNVVEDDEAFEAAEDADILGSEEEPPEEEK